MSWKGRFQFNFGAGVLLHLRSLYISEVLVQLCVCGVCVCVCVRVCVCVVCMCVRVCVVCVWCVCACVCVVCVCMCVCVVCVCVHTGTCFCVACMYYSTSHHHICILCIIDCEPGSQELYRIIIFVLINYNV